MKLFQEEEDISTKVSPIIIKMSNDNVIDKHNNGDEVCNITIQLLNARRVTNITFVLNQSINKYKCSIHCMWPSG